MYFAVRGIFRMQCSSLPLIQGEIVCIRVCSNTVSRGAPICIFELGSTFKVVAVSELSHLVTASSVDHVCAYTVHFLEVLPLLVCIFIPARSLLVLFVVHE